MNNVIATLIAVIVTLLLIVVAVVIGEQLFSASSAGNAVSELESIRNNVKSLFAGAPNYTGLTNAVLEQAGLMPTNMMSGTSGQGQDVDSWGGDVTIAEDANPAQFDVTFAGVPTSACSQLASYAAGNLLSVEINGTALTLPVAPAAAVSACNVSGQGANGGNTIMWQFG